MRVVEAHNIFSPLPALALDAHQFTRIDVVAVVRRIRTCVAAARSRGYDARAIAVRVTEQYPTTLMRISFLAVAAKIFEVLGWDLEHGCRIFDFWCCLENYNLLFSLGSAIKQFSLLRPESLA